MARVSGYISLYHRALELLLDVFLPSMGCSGLAPQLDCSEHRRYPTPLLPTFAVLMQWSRWGIENLAKDVETASKFTPVKALLGFNEPNHKEQANLTPREAAELWPQVVKVVRPSL